MRNETNSHRSKGEAKRRRCGGIKASPVRRKAKHRRCREIEASLIRRTRSADAQIIVNRLYWPWLLATSPIRRNRSAANAQIIANHSYRRRFRFYRWRLSATSLIWRNRSDPDAQIVANCFIGDGSSFIDDCYQRRHRFEQIEASLMLRSLRIVRINDGSGFIGDVTDSKKSKRRQCSNRCELFVSATVQVGYRRHNRFYWQRLLAMDWVLKNRCLVSFGIGVCLVLLGTKDWRLMRK